MNLDRALRTAIFGFAVTVAVALPGMALGQVLIDQTSARFDWQASAGAVSFYEIWVSRSTRDGHYEHEATVPSPSVVITAEMGEVVRMRVRAGNEKGFGPMSAPSASVRFGLSSELPGLGSPGVVMARSNGADTTDVFYANPDTSAVKRFSTVDPNAPPVQIGTETDENWQLVGSGDFDGDSVADLFWSHITGATRIWYIDANGYEEEAGPPSPGLAWKLETTGDFDGNGQDDIFWRDPAGPTIAWLRAGVDYALAYFPPMPANVWELLSIGDFDGDGFDDLLWRDVDTTDTLFWITGNDPYNGLYAKVREHRKRSLLWEVFETRDADGDGTEDVHWRVRQDHNAAEWWHMDADAIAAN